MAKEKSTQTDIKQDVQNVNQISYHTETVDLPSGGKTYPEDSPLAKGVVEVKYMTAKEEDILTNTNYIQKGIVLDKLIESLIISKVNYNDIITGDKNAYIYLVESIRQFPTQPEVSEMLSEAGFSRIRFRNLSNGIVALHSGWKI